MQSLIRTVLATLGLNLQKTGETFAWKPRPDEVEPQLKVTYPAIAKRAAREDAEILWADEVGVNADHHLGCGYAPKGEPAMMEVPALHIRVNRITAISNEGKVQFTWNL